MKYLPLYCLLFVSSLVYAITPPPIVSPNTTTPDDLTLIRQKEESRELSIEEQLVYKQMFSMAYSNIDILVDDANLKPKTWATVFSYGTIIAGKLRKNGSISYLVESALPGAQEISCNIEKLGGRVIIVSNYAESGFAYSQLAQLRATESELKKQKICYSSLIVANAADATNKNPRFTAISSGDYESVITTAKLPPLKIIAYFGTKFEDFPDFKANTASMLSPDSSKFEPFGYNYFLLPDFLGKN